MIVRHVLILVVLATALVTGACRDADAPSASHGAPEAQPAATATKARPNVLFVVWDTVRADRLSLYGHDRPTTPHLDEWARQARVFDDCVTVASTTAPSHLSMFTGVHSVRHQVTNETRHVSDDYIMLAEILSSAGYATYAFSENPHISSTYNMLQGFDQAEHPWDPQHSDEALRIALEKVAPEDRSPELRRRLAQQRNRQVKWVGELAQKAVENWLARQDPEQPFLVFLNYMEAHHPLVPPRKYRAQIMAAEDVEASYRISRTNPDIYRYIFGMQEFTSKELELIHGIYDAAIRELDEHFNNLLNYLRETGRLENTIVVLVGDHGENLGEHHLMDHYFSVHETLMRIPLVLYYPSAVPAGREARPVTNMDIFPTLLELIGLDPPVETAAVSLLHPRATRPRLGDWRAMRTAIPGYMRRYPEFDPRPWLRSLMAFYSPDGRYKLVAATDRRYELYDLTADPAELNNLIHAHPQRAQQMLAALKAHLDTLPRFETSAEPEEPSPVDEATLRRLRGLGYVGDTGDDEANAEEADKH